MHVLISGASIAGPALAYWLRRHGIGVTVVEKAPTVRGGGYPIDVRGVALDVLDRTGVLDRVRAADIHTHRISFVDARGRAVGALRQESLAGGVPGRDIEVPRGHLASTLYEAVRDDAEFLFDDSIAALREHDGGVEVTLASGTRRDVDVVIGADGLHSHTRRLAIGAEDRFSRYLGYHFAGFTLPNRFGYAHEGVLYGVPGRAAIMYAPGCTDTLHGFLVVAGPPPDASVLGDPGAQRAVMATAFADDGDWHVPELIRAMHAADDLYFDVVSQIHLPRWSQGRVAVVGDAAYAPSFLSGQGTSLALVGAYVLAGELAVGADHVAAFAGYERLMRPFAAVNQALASGGTLLVPTTARSLWLRNLMLRLAPLVGWAGMTGRSVRRAATALALPSYPVGSVT